MSEDLVRMLPSRRNPRSARRGTSPGRGPLLRLVLLACGLAAVCLVLSTQSALALPRPNWNPGPPWAPLNAHSPEMRAIRDMFWVLLVLSAIVFFGVTGVIFYCIARFSAPAGAPPPAQIYGSRRVEVAWTLVPFVVLVAAFGVTVKYIHDINTPPPSGGKPMDISAIGHQWWWEFQYPVQTYTDQTGKKHTITSPIVTADEVHVPVNVSVHFHVQSRDVIHSFWVPEVQRQIDANPGQDNAVFTTIDRAGIYDGDCYEYCGEAHAWMKFRLVAQPPSAFDAWVRHEEKPAAKPTGLAAQGQKVFLASTCITCHAVDGTPAGGAVGPNLTHLGSRWTIGAGAAPMTLSALMQWVQSPDTFKPGVNMPPYPLYTQQQLRALATYLLSLK